MVDIHSSGVEEMAGDIEGVETTPVDAVYGDGAEFRNVHSLV